LRQVEFVEQVTGIRPGYDLTAEFAAVVIEPHVEKLRAYPRRLSRRALDTGASEQPADVAEPRCPEG